MFVNKVVIAQNELLIRDDVFLSAGQMPLAMLKRNYW